MTHGPTRNWLFRECLETQARRYMRFALRPRSARRRPENSPRFDKQSKYSKFARRSAGRCRPEHPSDLPKVGRHLGRAPDYTSRRTLYGTVELFPADIGTFRLKRR